MQEVNPITLVVYLSTYNAKAKVGYFYVEIVVHQQIFRLYVSMGYSKLINRVQAFQDLPKVVPTGPFVKRLQINEVENFTMSHEF